jgi:RimJ/RimL family protein N-acetyltransferase
VLRWIIIRKINGRLLEGGGKMYKIARSREDEEFFHQLWGEYCEENNIPFLNNCRDSSRYLLLDVEKTEIGTLECSPYMPDRGSNVENFYSFTTSADIKNIHHRNIHEIGKLSIERSYRGKGYFKHAMIALLGHALKHKVDWYIAVANFRVYLYARTMGFQVEAIDSKFYLNEKIKAVPILLDVKHAIEHMKTFKEYEHVVNKLHARRKKKAISPLA